MKTVNNFEIEIKKSSLDISEIYSEINKLNKIKKEADEKIKELTPVISTAVEIKKKEIEKQCEIFQSLMAENNIRRIEAINIASYPYFRAIVNNNTIAFQMEGSIVYLENIDSRYLHSNNFFSCWNKWETPKLLKEALIKELQKKEKNEKERIKNVELKFYRLNNDKIGGEKV